MLPPLILLGQKAQRYDEALKKARKELQACGSYDCDAARQIFRLFPELKKSEGERIRKAISDILLIDSDEIREILEANNLFMQDIDAWLEKQGEQKPTVETKLKIEKGKWYICISQFCNCIEGRAYKATSDSRLMDDFGTEYDIHSDAYKYFRLWSIQDARDGDVLVDEDNNIGIHKEIEGLYWNSYIYLGCDGKLRGFSIGGSHKQSNTRPATKEQRDALFAKMKEAGYEWDSEKLELKKKVNHIPADKVEQDSTWSEDDESRVDNLCHFLEEYGTQYYGYLTLQGTISWLKFLKDRIQPQQEWSEEDEKEVAVLEAYIRSNDWSERHIDRALGIVDELVNKVKSPRLQKRWKPSSEQIATIEYIIKEYESTTIHLYSGAAKQLYSLLEQLKQL